MLHRKEFICRFLRLFCLVFLVEKGQERRNILGGFRNCFAQRNVYCRELILQCAERDIFNLHIGRKSSVLIHSRNGRRAENRKETPENVTAAFNWEILCGQKSVRIFRSWFTNVP